MPVMERSSHSDFETRERPGKFFSLVESCESLEVPGPELGKVVFVRRVSLQKEIISYQEPASRTRFGEPISVKRASSESVAEKYAGEETRQRPDHLEKHLSETFGEVPYSLENIMTFVESDLTLYRLFVAAAYSVKNCFGKRSPRGVRSPDLLQYVKRLIPVSANNQRMLVKAASQIEPPEIALEFRIRHVCWLGESDKTLLFCKVSMDGEPDCTAERTNLVEGTTRFFFNTRFLLRPTRSLDDTAVVVELHRVRKVGEPSPWGSRLRILGRMFSATSIDFEDDAKSDCVGTVRIPVSDIYSDGVIKCEPLEMTNGDAEGALLHFDAQFCCSRSDRHLDGLKRHIMLLTLCVQESIRCAGGGPVSDWHEVLNEEARALVFFHSKISSLSLVEDVMTKFIVISFMVLKKTFSLKFLYSLLCESKSPFASTFKESVEPGLRRNYEKSVKEICKKCFEFIRSLNPGNLSTNRFTLLELEFSLRTLYVTNDVNESIHGTLLVLESDVIIWIKTVLHETKDNPKWRLVTHSLQFLRSLRKYLTTMDDVVQKVVLNHSLTRFMYKELDGELMLPLKEHTIKFSQAYLLKKEAPDDSFICIRKESIGMMSEVRETGCYVSKMSQVPQKELKIADFSEWFEMAVVEDWFQWTQSQAVEAVETTVKNDFMQCSFLGRVESDHLTCLSYSAEQTSLAMQELVALWTLVAVPRTEACDRLFLTGLKCCAERYSELMRGLVESEGLLKRFHSDGYRCICVLANNLWYVHEASVGFVQETVGDLPAQFEDLHSVLEDSCKHMFQLLIDRYVPPIEELAEKCLDADGRGGALPKLEGYLGKARDRAARFMKWEVCLAFLDRLGDCLVDFLREMAADGDLRSSPAEVDDEEFLGGLVEVLSAVRKVCPALEAGSCRYDSFLSELELKMRREEKS